MTLKATLQYELGLLEYVKKVILLPVWGYLLIQLMPGGHLVSTGMSDHLSAIAEMVVRH
jgi:hypothetical protein